MRHPVVNHMFYFSLSTPLEFRLGSGEALPPRTLLGAGGARSGWDARRALRYAAFGACDGFCSHFWFLGLSGAVESSGWAASSGSVGGAAVQVLADAVLLSPVWCAAFLAVMALLEGRGARGAARALREDWRDLVRGNLFAWVPANAFMYFAVPVPWRVTFTGAYSLLYTVVLSLWAEGGRGGRRDWGLGLWPPEKESAGPPPPRHRGGGSERERG